MTDRQKELLEFVKVQHGSQVRKYTNEPYWFHVLAVADLCAKHLNDEEYPCFFEGALCHDLFEDTDCPPADLRCFLHDNGYQTWEADIIVSCVKRLTDEYTNENYPMLNRERRKREEATRLGKIGGREQSIKYADLIDNCSTIVVYDPAFAAVYLKEKREILDKMRGGNIDLLIECCYTIKESTNSLASVK